MGVHAGTLQVSQLSCLRTLPSQALNSLRARRGPSVFAPASDSSLWRKGLRNCVLSRTAGRKTVTGGKKQKKELGLRDTCRGPH